jgi:hypothetical protein
MSEWFGIVILAYCVVREWLFIQTTNKLVNKLMSRNYHEYKAAESVYEKKAPQIKMGLEPDEDLNELNGINPVV